MGREFKALRHLRMHGTAQAQYLQHLVGGCLCRSLSSSVFGGDGLCSSLCFFPNVCYTCALPRWVRWLAAVCCNVKAKSKYRCCPPGPRAPAPCLPVEPAAGQAPCPQVGRGNRHEVHGAHAGEEAIGITGGKGGAGRGGEVGGQQREKRDEARQGKLLGARGRRSYGGGRSRHSLLPCTSLAWCSSGVLPQPC